MTRRYLVLLGSALVLGMALSVLAHSGWMRPGQAPAPATTTVARVPVSIRVRDGVVTPGESVVPLGAKVAIEVVNDGHEDIELALSGYEGRLSTLHVAGATAARAEFTADRPGEDFAWLVDGRPAGRLRVAGSHLIEGHR
ncbi:MAG TPA: hypothetical protein VFR25_03945 [Candidatus Eisenbacteria bacterium]|nr:hypothetical protein [Candidatus Eisenbacteria bacterium]